MGAALGRQADAARRRHQHEASILVAGVIERIETARDERIVERADRQHPRAEHRLGQPERRQQQTEIVLGDAELDMLPSRRQQPFLRRRQALVAKDVGMRVAREDAGLVDPAAEIGRDRHVGRGRHHALGEFAAGAGNLVHQLAEALLRRDLGALGEGNRRHCQGRRARPIERFALGERDIGEEFAQGFGRDIKAGEGLPLLPFGDVVQRLEGRHLRQVE